MKKVYLHDFIHLVSGVRDFTIDLIVSYPISGFESVYHDLKTISIIDNDLVVSNFLYTVRFSKPDFFIMTKDNTLNLYRFNRGAFEVAFLLEDIRED